MLVDPEILEIKNVHHCGRTVLMHAVDTNNTQMVKFLLEYGAQIDSTNDTKSSALFYASTPAMIGILLTHGANIEHQSGTKHTPLSSSQSLGLSMHLIERGANIQVISHQGYTLIHESCNYNRLDLIKYYVSLGLDALVFTKIHSYQNVTPFHVAAQQASVVVLEYLLELGADINEESRCGSSTTKGAGHTALDYAYHRVLSNERFRPRPSTNSSLEHSKEVYEDASNVIEWIIEHGGRMGKRDADAAKLERNIVTILQKWSNLSVNDIKWLKDEDLKDDPVLVELYNMLYK